MNAALWFGAGIFFTFVAAPAIFSRPIKDLFGQETFGLAFAGLIAQALLERYFVLQYICASVALLHQVAEWLYLGKALQRAALGLLLGVFSLGLINGLGLQPKLTNLHRIRFSTELYIRRQRRVSQNRKNSDRTQELCFCSQGKPARTLPAHHRRRRRPARHHHHSRTWAGRVQKGPRGHGQGFGGNPGKKRLSLARARPGWLSAFVFPGPLPSPRRGISPAQAAAFFFFRGFTRGASPQSPSRS